MSKIPEFQMDEQAVTLLMENGPGGMDVKAFILQKDNDFPPRIIVAYEFLDADGEEVDRGIEGPEDGQSQWPDENDLLSGETPVTLAVQFLQAHGASSASASFFHPGVWYETESGMDSRTGETERYSF